MKEEKPAEMISTFQQAFFIAQLAHSFTLSK